MVMMTNYSVYVYMYGDDDLSHCEYVLVIYFGRNQHSECVIDDNFFNIVHVCW